MSIDMETGTFDVLPLKGEVWRHTKTGGLYEIVGECFNTITDQLEVIYRPLFASKIDRFNRQFREHEKAFLSLNDDGTDRFVKQADAPEAEVEDDEEGYARVGKKVAEMAERAKVAHAALPGVQAIWFFGVNADRFKVVVTVVEGGSP